MNKLFFVLLLLSFCTQVMAFDDVILPQNGYDASNNALIQNLISNEEFCDLEKKIFKKTFSSDSAQKRMSRLEKELFGMEQKGDIEERFDNLITASAYYQDGYRQGENSKSYVPPKQELNSWNYIQDYEFPKDYEQTKQTYKNEKYYDEDYLYPKKEVVQKQSKIKQFFSNLADVFSAGVVTGYTPPIDSYLGPDIYDSMTTFGGSNYIGLPQFPNYVRIPNRVRVPSYYRAASPYIPHSNSYYKPLPPNGRPMHHHPGYAPPPHHSRYSRPYTTGTGTGSYNSGAKVKLIY